LNFVLGTVLVLPCRKWNDTQTGGFHGKWMLPNEERQVISLGWLRGLHKGSFA
jgi:hypothetical protein